MPIKNFIDKARKEKKRVENIDTAKKVGVGIGIGAAIGSTIGILFAPKSGEETRKDIANVTKTTVGNIKEGVVEAGEKINKVIEDGMDKIDDIKHDAADKIHDAADKIHDADKKVGKEKSK